MTTFDEKYARAVEILEQQGITRTAYEPPVARLLRRFGKPVRPLHFMELQQLAIFQGATFGVMWGLFMWVFMWSRGSMPLSVIIFAIMVAGVTFGLGSAYVILRRAARAELPKWDDL